VVRDLPSASSRAAVAFGADPFADFLASLGLLESRAGRVGVAVRLARLVGVAGRLGVRRRRRRASVTSAPIFGGRLALVGVRRARAGGLAAPGRGVSYVLPDLITRSPIQPLQARPETINRWRRRNGPAGPARQAHRARAPAHTTSANVPRRSRATVTLVRRRTADDAEPAPRRAAEQAEQRRDPPRRDSSKPSDAKKSANGSAPKATAARDDADGKSRDHRCGGCLARGL